MESELRLRPEMIPALRQAYQDALDRLRPARDGFGIDGPAMGDQASAEFLAGFNRHSGALSDEVTAFEQRLRETIETLGAIERAYERHETTTAAALSRRLEG
jgi:hypothetical protein